MSVPETTDQPEAGDWLRWQRLGIVPPAEIARLRLEVERLRELLGHAQTALLLQQKEIERLRRDCGEAYQIVGALGSADDPAVDKALDNLHAAAEGRSRPHDDLLPFVSTPDPRDARIAELEAALREVREWYDNEFTPSYDVDWAALDRALGEEAGVNGRRTSGRS